MHEYGLPQIVSNEQSNEFYAEGPQINDNLILFENAIPPTNHS
jgi:hypothetical protein